MRKLISLALGTALLASCASSQASNAPREISNRERNFYREVRHEYEIREKIDNAKNYDHGPRIQLACSIAHNSEVYGNDQKSADECYDFHVRRQ